MSLDTLFLNSQLELIIMKTYKSNYRIGFFLFYALTICGIVSIFIGIKIEFFFIFCWSFSSLSLLLYCLKERIEKIIFDLDKNEISLFETSRFNLVKNKYVYSINDIYCEIYNKLTGRFGTFDKRFKISIADRGVLFDFSIYNNGWSKEQLEDLIKQIEKYKS